jgi:predicted Zn-dependent protease
LGQVGGNIFNRGVVDTVRGAGIAFIRGDKEALKDLDKKVKQEVEQEVEQANEPYKEFEEAAQKYREKSTAEQEYYIGRSVAAFILSAYQASDKDKVNQYLNILGQSLALASDKPETYKGYRFLELDSEEINAFAAPSGFILVTRGLLRLAKTEDEVAAILAHEIAHVARGHGMKSIKSARLKDLVGEGIDVAATASDSAWFPQAVAAFDETIGSIANNLMNGYSRGMEKQADLDAVVILRSLGYDPHSLIKVLESMMKMKSDGKGFSKTHPKPADRIKFIESALAELPAPINVTEAALKVRQDRYHEALEKI